MTTVRTSFLLLATTCAALPALSQTSPAYGPAAPAAPVPREQQISDYLALLQQIAPAAEEAARTYLSAFRLRCGHALDAATLRQAMTQEGGDPVLMALIRAAATQDIAARHRLVAQILCPLKVTP